jgi:probable HAF family extracellular repeat protein
MPSKTNRRSLSLTRSGSSRRPRMRAALIVAVAVTGLIGATALPAFAASYSITDLGSLGYPTTFPAALNESGEATGTSYLAEEVPITCTDKRDKNCKTHPERAFLFSAGKMTALAVAGGLTPIEGAAINASGEVAGTATSSHGREAFVEKSGQLSGLGALVSGGTSSAAAISESGAVAGSSSVSEGGEHAFLYSNGKMTDLGLIPGSGGVFTAASGINSSNQVVGSGDNAASDERAWLYSNGKMTDLGTLGGPNAAAYAINNGGEIVGSSQTAKDSEHPFLYKGGKMIDLGAFNLESVATAISNSGVIVGQTYELEKSGNAVFHAFIYSGGHFQDLNNLIPAGSGFVLTGASGINDAGQILVEAQSTSSGQAHALLLNPS